MLYLCNVTVIIYEWEITTNMDVTCNVHAILRVTFGDVVATLTLYNCVCWVYILDLIKYMQ